MDDYFHPLNINSSLSKTFSGVTLLSEAPDIVLDDTRMANEYGLREAGQDCGDDGGVGESVWGKLVVRKFC